MAVSIDPGIGEIGGEAIETAGEIIQKLLTTRPPPPMAAAAALPSFAATQEGTKQLRLILRARTREAKIQAKAYERAAFLGSPVAILVAAFGSYQAALAALIFISNNAKDTNNRTWAKNAFDHLKEANVGMPGLPAGLTSLSPQAGLPALPSLGEVGAVLNAPFRAVLGR